MFLIGCLGDVIAKDNFAKKWNLRYGSGLNAYSWADDPSSIDEIGCIHTCQGMEFDHVGVFIGKDLYYKDGHVYTNRYAISKDDKTSGIRLKSTTDEEADKLIRRTYKVLLTRGLKGCYIFCEDKALSDYLKKSLGVLWIN